MALSCGLDHSAWLCAPALRYRGQGHLGTGRALLYPPVIYGGVRTYGPPRRLNGNPHGWSEGARRGVARSVSASFPACSAPLQECSILRPC